MDDATPSGFLTPAQYAARIGVSRQRVHQLKQDGRIPVNDDGLVDVAQADANLATMLDQRKANRDRQVVLAGQAAAGMLPLVPAPADVPPSEAKAPVAPPAGVSSATDYWEQKARRERIEADRADLAYRQAIGKVVEADEVRRSRYETAYKVANALTQIPARVAPVIAPQDALRAEKLLVEEINRVLHELATDLDGQPGNDAGGAQARAA